MKNYYQTLSIRRIIHRFIDLIWNSFIHILVFLFSYRSHSVGVSWWIKVLLLLSSLAIFIFRWALDFLIHSAVLVKVFNGFVVFPFLLFGTSRLFLWSMISILLLVSIQICDAFNFFPNVFRLYFFLCCYWFCLQVNIIFPLVSFLVYANNSLWCWAFALMGWFNYYIFHICVENIPLWYLFGYEIRIFLFIWCL